MNNFFDRRPDDVFTTKPHPSYAHVQRMTDDELKKLSKELRASAALKTAAGWDESQHPRDEKGQFSESEGSGYKDTAQGVNTRTEAASKAMAAQTGRPFQATLYRGVDPMESDKINRIPSQFAVGEYRTPFPEIAQTYGSKVLEVPTRLENPYVMTLGERAYFTELKKEFGTKDPREFTGKLLAKGHDGLIVKNVPANRGEIAMRDSIEVIVFKKEMRGAASRETALHTIADSYLAKLRVVFLYAFARARRAADPRNPSAALDALTNALDETLAPTLRKIVIDGGVAAVGMMPKIKTAEFRAADGPLLMSFNKKNPRVAAWTRKHAAELITQISDTTREAIKAALIEAEDSGEDPSDAIAAAIGDEARADVIARTESMRAVHAGQREAWDQAVDEGLLDPEAQRVWIATGDDLTCPICEGLDGKVADLDGQYDGEYDAPPAHPNCRCTEGISDIRGLAEWDESLHPRDEKGQFSETEGASLTAARKDVAEFGKQQHIERVIAIDVKGQEVGRADGAVLGVHYPPGLDARLKDPSEKLTLVHNHPGGHSLSSTDITSFAKEPGLHTIEAVTEDGSIFSASRGPRFNVKQIDEQYANAYHHGRSSLLDSRDKGLIKQDDLNLIADHVAALGLGRLGYIHYRFKVDGLHKAIIEKHQAVVAQAVKAATSKRRVHPASRLEALSTS